MIQINQIETYKNTEKGHSILMRVKDVKFDGIEYANCNLGQVRGNHYHKKRTEYIFMVEGNARLEVEDPSGNFEEHILKPGEYVKIPPRIKHRVVGIEAGASFIVPFVGPSTQEDSYRWR